MPRQARLDLAGSPQLVIHRSRDDSPLFRRDEDYRHYLDGLRASSARYACAVHAYAFLPHEVRLLLTGSQLGTVGCLMQWLGRRHAHYANMYDGVRKPRWQGRYRSCPVGGDVHVLRASAFVEFGPVRAGLVPDPATYRWSSCAGNVLGASDPLITPHAAYLGLAVRLSTCRSRYRKLLAAIYEDEAELRMHVEQGRAWGSAWFLENVAAERGACRAALPRGRPCKRSLST